MRDLSEHAKKIGFEDSEKHLVPVLDKLGHEEEQALRQAVAEQLPAFAGYLKQVPIGFLLFNRRYIASYVI